MNQDGPSLIIEATGGYICSCGRPSHLVFTGLLYMYVMGYCWGCFGKTITEPTASYMQLDMALVYDMTFTE